VQNPSYSKLADAPKGVPISALVFGGRRRTLAPLVMQARSWAHGVLMGAGVASETTAAAAGAVGVVRRDPMAMKPFCGYNFADYWAHWLTVGAKLKAAPQIFHVNWFRRDAAGNYLWPGFSENLRVLRWMIERCEGKAHALDTPIGFMPAAADLDTSGLDLAPQNLEALLSVDPDLWRAELTDIGTYLNEYGERIPQALRQELAAALERVSPRKNTG
jgi:phosphoenolpyruvate carboxykinase (GTP)